MAPRLSLGPFLFWCWLALGGCAGYWIAETSAMIPGTDVELQHDHILLDALLVVPQVKLLFCVMQKVSSTEFIHLLTGLRRSLDPAFAAVSHSGRDHYYDLSYKHANMTLTDVANIMADKTWTKAVFYREPLTRFLSAFRSKCEAGHDEGERNFCEIAFGAEAAGNLGFREAVARLAVGEIPDAHFRPQAVFCGGLDKTLQFYNFVTELTPETSRFEVERMLKMVHVDPSEVPSLDESFPKPEEETNLLEQGTKKHFTGASNSLCEYYTDSSLVDIVQTYFAKDYEIFGLDKDAMMRDC